MTQFLVSRPRAALLLATILPHALLHALIAAWRDLKDTASVIRHETAPAIRYVLTGQTVPGVTRAIVKAKASTAAQAVTAPVASFFRKHIRNRLVALSLLLLFPVIVPYIVFRVIYEEIEWADMARCFLDLVFGVFDNRTV